jgi:integrase
MSPLRKQLEDHLAIRGMSERTREAYVGAVAALAKHYGRSPDRIGQEEIQRYLLHLLTERKLAPSSCNVAASALQFFYRVTLKRSAAEFALPRPKQPQKLPQILAREEVARLLAASENPKHRAMLMTAYGTGVRVSELCHLKVADIDSSRMSVRVEQGKGAKDRYTLLPERLLAELRRYWLGCRPKHWLFVGERAGAEERPIAVITAQRIYRSAKNPRRHHQARRHPRAAPLCRVPDYAEPASPCLEFSQHSDSAPLDRFGITRIVLLQPTSGVSARRRDHATAVRWPRDGSRPAGRAARGACPRVRGRLELGRP